ncbi:MAG: phage tailspike protein [Shewanella sp.]
MTANILVTSPYHPFTLPNKFSAVFNGYIYCGLVDKDPLVPANQVQIYLVNESGAQVPVSQPLRTNAGGFLVYNGKPAKFVTGSNHSLLVQDGYKSQIWYEPDVSRVDPDFIWSSITGPGGAAFIGGSITPITAEFLAGGATSGKDSTAAIEMAGSIGGTYLVPSGEYIISSAKISKSTTFIFEEGASFKRAPHADIRQSYWNDGVPMLDAAADGLTITFIDPVFDGNKDNQPAVQVGYSGPNATTEPSGWAFRYYPRNPATAKNCRFVFIRPKFKNGTSGYILVRGDDISRRFKTEILLDNPVFTDTIHGYGKNDPLTPTPLGWSSDYITAMDYVDLYGYNVQMEYSASPTPVGRYAPVGVRATHYGASSTSGGASIFFFGRTSLYGMGRKNQSYDGANFTNSNGIGAIDGYGEAKNLYIELLDAELCENVPARAKATIDTYHVGKAILKNCKRGVQVSPGSGGVGARVYIGDVYSRGGTNPQVEVVGTSTSARLASLRLGECDISGGVNEEGLTNNIAAIAIRNVEDVETGFLRVDDQDTVGALFIQNNSVKSSGRVTNTVKDGVIFDSISDTVDADYITKNTGGRGVFGTGSCKSFKGRFVVDGAVDYAIQANHQSGQISIEKSSVDNISGLSRGIYIGAAGGSVSDSYSGDGVTTPLAASDIRQIVQSNNSWNARTSLYSSSTGAPNSGAYRRGDITYIPATASNFIGWVCTVGGTAGSTAVFKRFGAIEA